MLRQGLARDLVIGGGFFTGIATVIVAMISSGDTQQARILQSQEQARIVVSRQYHDQLENRRSLCEAAIGYIEDDKPNLLLTGPQRQVAMEAVVSGLRNCSSDIPQPPPISRPEIDTDVRGDGTAYPSKSRGEKP